MASYKTEDGLKYRGAKDLGRAARGELPKKVQRRAKRVAQDKPVGSKRVKGWLS